MRFGSARAAVVLVALAGPLWACDETVVETVPIATITVTASSGAIEVGDSVLFSATISDESGNGLPGRAVTWTSSDSGIATVDSAGWVTGVAEGAAWIRATAEGRSDSAAVSVVPISVRSVDAQALEDTLSVMEVTRATATPRDRDGNPMTASVTWATGDSAVAVVDTAGVVLAVAAGTTDLIATAGEVTDTITMVVRGEQVRLSEAHTCALVAGAAYCWGANGDGQLGDGGITAAAEPVAVGGGFTFSALATGGYHTCGVTSGGAACWGGNWAGQLGDGSTTGRLSPTPVLLPAGVALRFIVAGGEHSCGLATSGVVYCWGENDAGQLGTGGGASELPVAIDMPAGAGFRTLSSGWGHVCGVTWEGRLYCWGNNDRGQLGDGTATQRDTPVEIPAPGSTSWWAVDAGGQHTCALTHAGALYCWGNNDDGQLGDGTDTERRSPAAVAGGRVFRGLAVGGFHACAFEADGDTYCWGDGDQGELGTGVAEDADVPTATAAGLDVVAMAAGEAYTCAIDRTGALHCWGSRQDGRLGDGATAAATAPVPVSGGHVFTTIVAARYLHACGVAGGEVYCWGLNEEAGLGDGTDRPSATPALVQTPADSAFVTVSVGGSFACGLTDGGTAYCWGTNWGGQLGDGSGFDSLVPVRVDVPGVAFRALTAGGEHGCAISTTDALYCWGYNLSGEVGDGTNLERFSPVEVLAGTGIRAVAAGAGHTCAATNAGSLFCWGGNADGQVGDGSTTDTSSPVDVTPAGASIVNVTAGVSHSCALDDAGSAYCWGANWSGEVGDGTTSENRPTPTAVAGGQLWSALSAGAGHTCGLTAGGEARCWGRNDTGQYGDGGVTDRLSPSPAATGIAPVSVSAGWESGCAVTADGTGYCWGHRGHGALGDGATAFALAPAPITVP